MSEELSSIGFFEVVRKSIRFVSSFTAAASERSAGALSLGVYHLD